MQAVGYVCLSGRDTVPGIPARHCLCRARFVNDTHPSSIPRCLRSCCTVAGDGLGELLHSQDSRRGEGGCIPTFGADSQTGWAAQQAPHNQVVVGLTPDHDSLVVLEGMSTASAVEAFPGSLPEGFDLGWFENGLPES